MRTPFQNDLKAHLRTELLHTRTALRESQEKMAERLGISVRAYVDLERGKSCCSLVTYLFYLRYCSKNAQASLNEVLALLPPTDSDESETKS